MKKLLKRTLLNKREKVSTQDHIAILISRLTDSTDVIYDEKFARGFEEYSRRK
jgi:hypothetical protein